MKSNGLEFFNFTLMGVFLALAFLYFFSFFQIFVRLFLFFIVMIGKLLIYRVLFLFKVAPLALIIFIRFLFWKLGAIYIILVDRFIFNKFRFDSRKFPWHFFLAMWVANHFVCSEINLKVLVFISIFPETSQSISSPFLNDSLVNYFLPKIFVHCTIELTTPQF